MSSSIMDNISRNDTIEYLQQFINRHKLSCGCKWAKEDEMFIEGVEFAIRVVKLMPEATLAQVRFVFDDDNQD